MLIFSRIFVTLLALLAITGCSKQAKLARHLERADRYYAQGDYDHADAEYINVLRLDPQGHDPKSAVAYERLGVMALEQGRLGRAYRALLRAYELDTNKIEFHGKLGLAYLAIGKPKEARGEANFVLDRQPQNEDAPLLLAEASTTANDAAASRQRLQKLAVPPAKRAAIEVALGTIALRQNDVKSAAAAYESARAADAKFGPLHSALAIFYWSQNDVKHAEDEFQLALASVPIRSPIRLRYAQFKLQTGDVAAGKAMLDELVRKAPDFLPAWMGLAEIAGSEKKFDEAAGDLDKLLAHDPENYDARMLAGRYALAQGDAARAAGDFEKLTRAYPKASVPFYQLALAQNALNDTTRAIANLNQALILNPAFPEATIVLAQTKMSRGDYSSAVVNSLRQLSEKQPELAPAQLVLAEAYRGQGNLDDAAQVYRHLETAYPTNAQVPLLFGDLLVQQHRLADARQEYTKALSLAPEYLPALEKVTDMDITEKRYSAAGQRLQKFMEKNPSAPEPNLLVAKLWLAQGDLKQAAAVLSQTITSHPEFVQAYLMLGNAYNEAKDVPHALEITRKLLAKYSDQPGGQMLLAALSEELKDYNTSEQAYEKVLAKNPHNGVALNNLAYLYSEHGQLEKGYEMARRARELLPRDPATADTLGWISYKRGDYEQAAALLQESVGTLSSVPDIQLHLGMTRYMLGDEERARASLQYAAQSKNNFPEKELASRCLTILAIDPKNASSDARAILEKRLAEQPGDTVALMRLASIYTREGNGDKAIASYETALKSNPRNAPVLVQLARIYATRSGEPDKAKALELAKSAHNVAPDDTEVSRLLGRLSYLMGDDKRSYDLLKESVRKQPGDAELQFDFAETAYAEGRIDEAEAGMRSALQAPGFSRLSEAKRFLEMTPLANNPSAAVAATAQVEQALKADAGYLPALMVSGVIQEAKNDPTAARQTYEKALSHHPDFIFAKRRMAILLAQSASDDKRAYEYAGQARAAFPNDPELAKALGIIIYRQGDYSRSAKFLKESAVQKAGDAQSMFYLGMAQYKLRERAESKKNLLQAVNLNLPDNLAGEAKKVLAELN